MNWATPDAGRLRRLANRLEALSKYDVEDGWLDWIERLIDALELHIYEKVGKGADNA
jgi:hypothetical protein